MKSKFFRHAAETAGVFFLLYASLAPPLHAQDSSSWVRDSHSALRLLAGSRDDRSANVLLAGIEIELQPGWKTYWRTPGDSGVPPQFDFSASENVSGVSVLWPAPGKFPDGAGGTVYGYHDKVIFPLRIAVKDAGKPTILRGAMHYAVCEKLCLPVDARAEIRLDSAASTQDSALLAALEQIPKPARIGDEGTLTIARVSRMKVGATAKPRLLIDIAAPEGAAIELYAEGPDGNWALPEPKPVQGGKTKNRQYTLEIDGAPTGADIDQATLALTLVGAATAYEYTVPLRQLP